MAGERHGMCELALTECDLMSFCKQVLRTYQITRRHIPHPSNINIPSRVNSKARTPQISYKY
jgi:hypothetical protein